MKKLSIALIVLVGAVLVIAQSKFPNKLIAPSAAITNMIGTGDHVGVSPDGTLQRTNIAGGSGTPGGDNHSIQFNTNGAFGGDTSLQYQYPVGGGDPTSGKIRINLGGKTNTMDANGFGTDTAHDTWFKTADTARWYLKSAGHWQPAVNNTYDVGSASFMVRTAYVNNVSVGDGSSAVGLIDLHGGGVTNISAINWAYEARLIPTNNALSNIVVNMATTNTVELYATNNLTFTNWAGLATGVSASKVVLIYPQLIPRGVNWGQGIGYNVRLMTNANSPLWTTLTNDKTYALSITAINTNLFASLTLWE